MQTVQVVLVPLLRDAAGTAPDLVQIHPFRTIQCRLKCVPSRHHAVYAVSSVGAPQGCIRKIPLACVEAEPMVYERRCITVVCTWIRSEHHLPSITIHGPLVQDKNARKVAEIGNSRELLVRQIVIYG